MNIEIKCNQTPYDFAKNHNDYKPNNTNNF